jgi:hypothetical protein
MCLVNAGVGLDAWNLANLLDGGCDSKREGIREREGVLFFLAGASVSSALFEHIV